jgi:hypothetical protein
MKTLVLFRTLARVFKRFGSPESNGNSLLSSTSTSKRSGGFTFLVVLPTIKEIQNYILLYIKELYYVPLLLVHNSLAYALQHSNMAAGSSVHVGCVVHVGHPGKSKWTYR